MSVTTDLLLDACHDCPVCGRPGTLAVTECPDGHGAECPDRLCLDCGTALFVDPPVRAVPAASARRRGA